MTLITAIILALIAVESGGKTEAVNGVCVGVLQLKPIFVEDVNRILGRTEFALPDRECRVKSIRMARIWLEHYGQPEWTIQDYARAFRTGPSTVGTPAEPAIADYCQRVENLAQENLSTNGEM